MQGHTNVKFILSCVRVQFDVVTRCDTAVVSPCNEFLCRRDVASVAKLLQLQVPDL